MGILKVIEWADNSSNTIVHKIDTKGDVIARGSALTVREGQVAIFCDKGRMADVFLPGFYKLETSSLPVLTKLLSWKYGFETPFKSEVYYVNTNRFTKMKWGTPNPMLIRDPEFGAVRVRAFGTYSFRVKDAYVFMTELSGTKSSFRTEEITDHIRSMLVMGISDAIGESGLSVIDMTGNLIELSDTVKAVLAKRFKEIGLELTDFNFENVSLPPELEKKLDEVAGLSMMRKNVDVYAQIAQADAMKEAARNPGMAGAGMSAGLGLGFGMNMMGAMSANAAGMGVGGGAGAAAAVAAGAKSCPKCNASLSADAKFCTVCGTKIQAEAAGVCRKCGAALAPGAKFCPECGTPTAAICPECGAKLAGSPKFCPECGHKM